jgi:hypothetical protein
MQITKTKKNTGLLSCFLLQLQNGMPPFGDYRSPNYLPLFRRQPPAASRKGGAAPPFPPFAASAARRRAVVIAIGAAGVGLNFAI